MLDDVVREVLVAEGGFAPDSLSLTADADLYQHGLTSHGTVNVMLGLEDRLQVEFPDTLLRKSTFQSIRSIREALISMGCAGP